MNMMYLQSGNSNDTSKSNGSDDPVKRLSLSILVFLVISLLMGWPATIIWNDVIVQAITVANPITYWQGVGMFIFFGMYKLL